MEDKSETQKTPSRSELVQKAYDATDTEMRASSAKVSDVCRNVGVGSLAIFYAMLFADKDPALDFYNKYRWYLTVLAFLGAITFMIDYLQYLFGYLHLKRRFGVFSRQGVTVNLINAYQDSIWKNLSIFSFWSKNLFAAVCCLMLVFIIGNRVING